MSLIYLMTPIHSTKDQNTLRRIIQGYIYTLAIKIHIKEKTFSCLIFTVILETFAKSGE